jgi:hypothetical protein
MSLPDQKVKIVSSRLEEVGTLNSLQQSKSESSKN